MLLITGNKNKVREFEEILGFKIRSQSLDLEEIQEVDIELVSEYKAKKAYETIKEPIIVEDIGLFFDELNGLPGALIKWFEKRLSYKEICDLVKKNRKATAKICITYFDGKEIKQFLGEIEGMISTEPKGKNGFGWDCIFIPKGSEKTFGEMNKEEKNNISMRRMALEKLKSCNFIF